MPRSIVQDQSVNLATVGETASPVSGSKKSGDTGARTVDSVPGSEVARELTKSERHKETNSGLLQSAQPAKGKSVVGANNGGSAQTQLNAILSDGELANCYKSQAQDTYFNASEHAFKELQSKMEALDLDDPKKMAKEFKRALKEVRQDLKHFERDASDLKVTITTQSTGQVQLIPFKLKEIDPDLLKELLGKALKLTEKAMVQKASDPENISKEAYEGKISSCCNQIPPLLQKVDEGAKATFESSLKLLQFPRVEMYFDASAFGQVENPQAQSGSSASTPTGQLGIDNTGGFYKEEEPEGLEEEDNHENLSVEEPHRQRIRNAKSSHRSQFESHGVQGDTDQVDNVMNGHEAVNKELGAWFGGRPYSTFGGGGSKVSEHESEYDSTLPVVTEMDNLSQVADKSVQEDIPAVGTVPTPPKLNEKEFSLFGEDDIGKKTLDHMDDKQRRLFKEKDLWVYLKTEELQYIKEHDHALKKLIPDFVFQEITNVSQKTDHQVLPKIGDIAARFQSEPTKIFHQAQKGHSVNPMQLPAQDDGVGLFRAIIAYRETDTGWLNSSKASKEKVINEINKGEMKSQIIKGIESAIEYLMHEKPLIPIGQNPLAIIQETFKNAFSNGKSNENKIAEKIFNEVIAHGDFGFTSFNGLAKSSGFDTRYLDETKPLLMKRRQDVEDSERVASSRVGLSILVDTISQEILKECGIEKYEYSEGKQAGVSWSSTGCYYVNKQW